MKKRILYVVSLILISVMFVGCEETKTYELEYNQSKLEIQQLNEQLKNKDGQILTLQEEINNIELFNKYYSEALTAYNFAIFDRYSAGYSYDLWMWYYGQGYFYESIEYCENARTLYVSSNGYYQNTITYFEKASETAKENYVELIEYYMKASQLGIDLNWAMYEACEYFESACNYYSQGLLDTGDLELERGNEKIRKHDGMIKTHNNYISKIEILSKEI